MPHSRLPTEVVEEVIDQARDDRASLHCLTLLCKALLTRARYHLFTSIVIRSIQQVELSRGFLDSHPWALPLVRKVTLSIDFPRDYSKPNIPLLDIVRSHLFTRLPNLRAWRMRAGLLPDRNTPWLSFHPSALVCYRAYGSSIQSLELEGIPFREMSHFVRLVSAFTTMHTLTCYNIRLRKAQRTLEYDASQMANKLSRPLKIQYLHVSVVITCCIQVAPWMQSERLIRTEISRSTQASMST